MIVINFDEYNLHRKKILEDLPSAVFIYPTDTLYSMGCDATNEKLVAKVRKLKQSNSPFSIIVPNKEWIYNNCIVTQEAEEWIRKLPGAYTLILRLKNPKAIAKNVHNSLEQNPVIAIRMPNHWFLAVSYTTKLPMISTSANVAGQEFMIDLDSLDTNLRNGVDYVFYEGRKTGQPSTTIHLEGQNIVVEQKVERKSKTKNIQFPIQEIMISKDN